MWPCVILVLDCLIPIENLCQLKQEVKTSKMNCSKQVYMELINAYANCGLFEKAKQVLTFFIYVDVDFLIFNLVISEC